MTHYIKNAQPDMPDVRDWVYQPPLKCLHDQIAPRTDLRILNQHSEGSCTGFALAAAINHLYLQRGETTRVSPRMLYEMARCNDEWPGESYHGSSLRGAIRGWRNMGVCTEQSWPYRVTNKGQLTIKRAKDARNHTIGAYYRLRPSVVDFHAALNEAGVIVVSAKTHKGWDKPQNGQIEMLGPLGGGHAFAIVGYNDRGFWVQNSWDENWGANGLALWTYPDWAENLLDAWVFRLALPTPEIFNYRPSTSAGRVVTAHRNTIDRCQIAGHFVHIDDGDYHDSDRYWSNSADVAQTAELVANSADYDHVLFYFHGGLNSPKDSARRIAAMKKTFKDNRIYPFHFMYDTGLVEELKDLLVNKERQAAERVGGLTDLTDRMIEGLMRWPGTKLWKEMKSDARAAFEPAGAGTDVLGQFLSKLAGASHPKQLHLVGHSTGAIVIGRLLRRLQRRKIEFSSCSLMAPACTLAHYEKSYLPVLQNQRNLTITDTRVYALRDQLELDDNVSSIYRKSLLYLISNAFEGERGIPLLGLETSRAKIDRSDTNLKLSYSDGVAGQQSRSKSHGGFDNDPVTMNHILGRVLGRVPDVPFTRDSLDFEI